MWITGFWFGSSPVGSALNSPFRLRLTFPIFISCFRFNYDTKLCRNIHAPHDSFPYLPHIIPSTSTHGKIAGDIRKVLAARSERSEHVVNVLTVNAEENINPRIDD